MKKKKKKKKKRILDGRRHTMEVYDNLETVLSSPVDGFGKIRKLSLNVGFPARDIPCPVTDGNADMIKTAGP